MYNRGSQGKFVFNLGIYNNSVEKLEKRFHYKDGAVLKAEGATLQSRLYKAGGNGKQWWEVGQDTQLQSLSDEIVEKMECEGLPWLMDNNRIDVFESFWKNYPSSEAAFTTAYLLGDEQEAVRRVKAAIKSAPGGGQYAIEWANSVGLEV